MEKYYKAQSSKDPLFKESKKSILIGIKYPGAGGRYSSLLLRYAPLSEWEKDIISIVRSEAQYFMPQIETKIMNEGGPVFGTIRF